MIPSNANWQKDWKSIEFDETLEIVGIIRGQSAAHIQAKSTTKNDYYTIFLVDLLDMMVNGDLKDMRLSGTFIIRKRGMNLGIRLKNTPDMEKERITWQMYNPIPNWIR